MAYYRQVHVSIWKDEFFLGLPPNEKLLFIYLFSNESASLSGIYKIALRVICFETCLPMKRVVSALEKFAAADKVHFQGGIVWVKNLRKYNKGGATVDVRVKKDLQEIPDCALKEKYIAYYDEEIPYPDQEIPYPYPMDRVSSVMECNVMEGNVMKGNEKDRWEIPKLLDTDEFRKAWKDFQKHRKEKRNSLTPLAGTRTMNKLSKYPAGTAIRMLEQSIENGWAGVFEVKGDKPSTKPEKSVLEILKE